MLEVLIKKMEDNIDSDDFEWIEEECIEKIEESDLGINAVEPLIKLMERHPLADFGVPGAIVHFVEKYYNKGYEDILYQSIKRSPSMHTVWMLNRICNDKNSDDKFRKLLAETAQRNDIDNAIAKSAKDFLGN
ncbi:MAG: hypothetical protein K2J95_10955 [Lachnospiraceae bacterium]|nr:hypothetical protein [Lachnospiraceae bacterium]